MMVKKDNQRVRLTKTLLKTSLIELMQNKQIHKITIKELCAHAEINRSTFYLYYEDQFALLNEIEDDFLNHVKTHLIKIEHPSNDRNFLKELLAYIKNNAQIVRILLFRLENLSFQTSFISIAIDTLKLNLKYEYPDHLADYIYRYLTMGCLSIIKKWIEDDFTLSLDELSDLIFQLSDHAASSYN